MLITADARVTIREAAARFNTLLTAAVAGPSRRPNKHPMENWNKILGLALYCHPCLHTFVFLASQATFASYDTMGTVVIQTYLLQYHGDSGDTNIQELWYHGDSGETYDTTRTVLRQWWWHKIFLMTKIRDKRCQNISNNKGTWQKVSNNLIKPME